MEGNTSITRSSQRATEDSIVNKEVCQPIRGLTLQGRTVEDDKVSESTKQGPDTRSYHLTYFCTFCSAYEHNDLPRWQFHEYHVHQKSRNLKCPECFALEYDNTQSTHYDHFDSNEQPNDWPEDSYNTIEHYQETCKHIALIGRKSYRQNFWGCGFCSEEKVTPMQSWQERCSHVASHMHEGKHRSDWGLTNLIKVLLRQPKISDLWTSYIHSLHGPYAKDQPEFHWDGTNGLCQKILRELEIGLRSVNEQIELVKMAYVMGANESTHPIDSLFSASWTLDPRDQSLESSRSSPESDTMGENTTEGDFVTGVKIERSLQHESSTKMDDRECRTRSSSSLRGVVSITLLIEKFRQLLPRDSSKRRRVKTAAAPGFRNSDEPRCSSPGFSNISRFQYSSTHAYKYPSGLDGKNEKLSVDPLTSIGPTNCLRSSPDSDVYRAMNSANKHLEVERECTKQTLPNGISLILSQSQQSNSSSNIARVSSGATGPSVIAEKELDCSDPNFHREPRCSGRTNTLLKDGSAMLDYRAIRKNFVFNSYSSRRFDSRQTGDDVASIRIPNHAHVYANCISPVPSTNSLLSARDSSAREKRGQANWSVSEISNSGQFRRWNREQDSATNSTFSVQHDSLDQVLSRHSSLAIVPTAVSSSPAAPIDQGLSDILSYDDYQPRPSSSQQQDNTINPAVLSVANTSNAADGSNNNAFHPTEFIGVGVTDNRLNLSWKGIGHNLSQPNTLVDQTSSYTRQPLTIGRPSQKNPLSLPYSYIVGSSSLPVLDNSSMANSKIAMRNVTHPLIADEPLHNNPLVPSKKRNSSAVGSSMLDVPDCSSEANLRSSQFGVISEGDDEKLNKRQRTGFDTLDNDEGKQLLACPYYLRHPTKYMKERSCPGPGWDSVHRLKAHLYKCHERPIQCFRCSQCFKSEEDRNAHQRIAEACHMKPLSIADGMSEEQKKVIKRKTRAKTEEDKWRGIWKILFPMDAEADNPKPYYPIHSSFITLAAQSTKLPSDCDFEEFLSRGFREKVTQKIEMAIKKEDDLIEDNIKKHMVNIVHECTTELFQGFRQWKNGNTSNKISEVNASQKNASQIGSTPSLSSGLSSEGGVLIEKKTPTESPQQRQDDLAGEDYLHGLNFGSFNYTDSWPATLDIDPELNAGAQYVGAGFTDIPALSMAGSEEGELLTMSKLEGKQRMNP